MPIYNNYILQLPVYETNLSTTYFHSTKQLDLCIKITLTCKIMYWLIFLKFDYFFAF